LLTLLSRVAREARDKAVEDGADDRYADALAAYLALYVGRVANRSSSQSFWNPGRETIEQVFARNAMPMIWVSAEGNPFSSSSANVLGQLTYLVEALDRAPSTGSGTAVQRDAKHLPTGLWLISTDPPYYDNVPYADLSDFFYLWHRAILQATLPALYETLTTPKRDELIAEPARHASLAEAEDFFEARLREVFVAALEHQWDSAPMTLYYALSNLTPKTVTWRPPAGKRCCRALSTPEAL